MWTVRGRALFRQTGSMGIGNETALKGAFALDLGSASESTRSKTRPGIGIDFGTGGTAPASVRGTG